MISWQLFFQGKAVTEEEAFVLFVRKNALQVLIPKYGLEGTVFMDKQSGVTFNQEVQCSKAPQVYLGNVSCCECWIEINILTQLYFFLVFKEPSLKFGDVTYRLFDRVTVNIQLDKSATENRFLSFNLSSKKVVT